LPQLAGEILLRAKQEAAAPVVVDEADAIEVIAEEPAQLVADAGVARQADIDPPGPQELEIEVGEARLPAHLDRGILAHEQDPRELAGLDASGTSLPGRIW